MCSEPQNNSVSLSPEIFGLISEIISKIPSARCTARAKLFQAVSLQILLFSMFFGFYPKHQSGLGRDFTRGIYSRSIFILKNKNARWAISGLRHFSVTLKASLSYAVSVRFLGKFLFSKHSVSQYRIKFSPENKTEPVLVWTTASF